jgi:hypothetical protein
LIFKEVLKNRLIRLFIVLFCLFLRSQVWGETVQKLTDPNSVDSGHFGFSVDLDGNTAVIGARHDNSAGAAYIYSYDGYEWNRTASLSAPNSTGTDCFSQSVAISGNTVVIGAPDYDANGVAFVYEYNGNEWTGPAILRADVVSGHRFGWSVDIDDNTIVVGYPADNNNRGSAYVFQKSGSLWTQQQKLLASDGHGTSTHPDGDQFANSVSIDGSRIVVGAELEYLADMRMGAVYVYEKSGGNWPQYENHKLTASDGVKRGCFGKDVSVSGDTIAVGAYGRNNFTGKVYIYDWNDAGNDWDESPIEDPTPNISADFGMSVSLDGRDKVLIGARSDKYQGISTGTTYFFTRSDGIWTGREYVASDLLAWDYFGCSVGLSGSNFIVGAYKKDQNSPPIADCGAAYIVSLLNIADLDKDGKVDFKDLAIFVDQWLLEKLSFDIAPIGGDGIVNFLDFAVFADNWQGDMNQLFEFASQWLRYSAYCADIAPSPSGDGIVNFVDFALFAENWLKAD